jgi:Kdo2-lipid IVA lauroyltransferase/acyltransferase
MRVGLVIRKGAESLLVALGFILVPPLPRCVVVRLARGLGLLAYRVARRERLVGLANLDLAYGDEKTREEKIAILREAFQTFALCGLDIFWFALFTRRRFLRHARLDKSLQYVLDNAPMITQTAHLGNWEMLAQASARAGIPVTSVVAPLSNPLADWALNLARRRAGQTVVRRRGAVRALVRTLTKGGCPALVMDQNTLPDEGGAFIEFFGLPVPVSLAAGLLAVRRKVPMVFTYCVADRRGDYVAFCEPPLEPPADALEAARYFAGVTESVIRRDPGKWLWMYKRWKFVPEGAPIDNYPFYARKWPPEDTVPRRQEDTGGET